MELRPDLLLPAAAIDKVQHVLLLEASKGGGAELQLSGAHGEHPFSTKIVSILSQFPGQYNPEMSIVNAKKI